MRIISRIAKHSLLIFALCLSLIGRSQTPQGISYQAVIRDGSGKPIADKDVGVRITLDNASNVAYYTETQTARSNALGIININQFFRNFFF